MPVAGPTVGSTGFDREARMFSLHPENCYKAYTVKFLNCFDTKTVAETTPKFKQKRSFQIEKLCPKGVDGMASSVDPDQTAPLGAV